MVAKRWYNHVLYHLLALVVTFISNMLMICPIVLILLAIGLWRFQSIDNSCIEPSVYVLAIITVASIFSAIITIAAWIGDFFNGTHKMWFGLLYKETKPYPSCEIDDEYHRIRSTIMQPREPQENKNDEK